MNARDLRQKYIEFFVSKEHKEFPSSPLIPIDVTGKLDESLLFTGAGMVQFKPYFRGVVEPPHRRLVTCQNCLRTTDIEETGDPWHLTFFQMLGNFSFGDYFKKEAIEFAWEFLTSEKWLNLDKNRICVTVFEQDDEAYRHWEEIWKKESFEPSEKIHRLGEEKNYWPAGAFTSGPPGPCGPCTEIFYRCASEKELTGDFKTDEAAGRWVEIWNLVFLQFEWKGELKDPTKPHLGYRKLGMDPLPKPGVDTGMGLERTAAVLGAKQSVYETDTFAPIVRTICERAKYIFGANEEKDRAVRIIADHLRAASFCIADGITPTNTGRGYVLRRIIRRCVFKGQHTLGMQEPFLAQIFPSVIEALGDSHKELSDRKETIMTILNAEETQFRRTIEQGLRRFWSFVEQFKRESLPKRKRLSFDKLPGRYVFTLYDTYGFPYELTEELAKQHGFRVSYNEFWKHMEKALQRARAASDSGKVFETEKAFVVSSEIGPSASRFIGYFTMETETTITKVSPEFDKNGLSTGRFRIALEQTPFYAEAGGQVGDTGTIECEDFVFIVHDTQKEGDIIWHIGEFVDKKSFRGMSQEEITDELKKSVVSRKGVAKVDVKRRRNVMRNHTATHLLHAALRKILGLHVAQSGSLVAPERLRFDFTHGAPLNPEEIERIEKLVNEKIAEAIPVVVHENVSLQEAKNRGAMMLFGEKYGDKVRMIEIPSFSLELCGGTHVGNTAEIGLFKIISESSSASGIRRIEAVTGLGAYEWAKKTEETLEKSASLLKTPPEDLPKAIEKLQAQVRQLQREKEQLIASATTLTETESIPVGPVNLYRVMLKTGGPEAGKLTADRLIERDSRGVAVVGVYDENKVTLFCKVGPSAQKNGAHAGLLLREIARRAGGGGGGNATFAQAGTKDSQKLSQAMDALIDIVKEQIKTQ